MSEQQRNDLEADAGAIGRRAAIKLAHRFGAVATRLEIPDFFDRVAETVEAEIRSAEGTPRPGELVLRFTYAEAVQTVTAILEAMHEGRSATEEEILAELREKFFASLGIRLRVECLRRT